MTSWPLWTVPRDWSGETCAILASGPSMSRDVAEHVRGRCRVIAVNNQGVPTRLPDGSTAPALAPWADVLYASDEQWWRHHRQHSFSFAGTKVSVNPCGGETRVVLRDHPEVRVLGNGRKTGLEARPTHLKTGGNSGYAAINLAVHFGVSRILLFGYDMHGMHWFGQHPRGLRAEQAFPAWLERFGGLAAALKERKIEVINCTPDSALKVFPFARLEDVLPAA